jgi:hypothetical protein
MVYGRRGRTDDDLVERWFEFVPLCGIVVFLDYRLCRSDCSRCPVTVDTVPWSDDKNPPRTYRWYLATWAKRLSSSEVGSIVRTSWITVRRSVEQFVPDRSGVDGQSTENSPTNGHSNSQSQLFPVASQDVTLVHPRSRETRLR